MEFLKVVISILLRNRYLFEVIIAGFLFIKKEHFRKYSFITLPLLFAALFVFGYFVHNSENNYISLLRYLVLDSGLFLMIFLGFDVSIYKALFFTTGSMALQHLSFVLYHFIPAPYMEESYLKAMLLLLAQEAILASMYVLLYFLFIRKIRKYDIKKNKVILSMNVLIVLVDVFFSIFKESSADIYSYIYDFLLTFISFFCMSFILQHEEEKKTREIQQTLLEKEKKEFELLKSSMDSINIKCHDMRHVLNKNMNLENEEYQKEIKENVEIYDSYIKTGNTQLDITLMDKKLQCRNKNITFTIMADASSLSFMKSSDIYSLFGNALENAIDYLSTKDEDKRILNLSMKNVQGFLTIRIENYFDDELVLKDGLPSTSKKDTSIHGFGMKSIRNIVEKYSGGMKIISENQRFILSLVFPLNEENVSAITK